VVEGGQLEGEEGEGGVLVDEVAPFEDVHLLGGVLFDFGGDAFDEVGHVFDALAVYIDAASTDKTTLRDKIHRITGQNGLSRPMRPSNTNKSLPRISKKGTNQLILQFTLHQSILSLRCPIPQKRLFLLENRPPPLKIPINLAPMLLLLPRKKYKMLRLFFPMINLHGQSGRLKTHANFTPFLP